MPGPSGYTTAFTRPDPLDPNDRQRQQTQARSPDFPYDRPVSYGRAVGTDMDGAAYQSGVKSAPPVPRKLRASDWKPKDPWNLAYEALTDPYEPGEQADDALALGYGSHGRMGEDDDDDVDMDDLRKSFRSCIPTDELGGAFATLLAILSAFSDDGEGRDSDDGAGLGILSGGDGDDDSHVFAPGAEDDPETL